MSERMHNVYGTLGEDTLLDDRRAKTLQTLAMIFMADTMPKSDGEVLSVKSWINLMWAKS